MEDLKEVSFLIEDYYEQAKIQAPKDEPDPEKQFVSAFGPKSTKKTFTMVSQRGLINFVKDVGCKMGEERFIYLGSRETNQHIPYDGATHVSQNENGLYHFYKKTNIDHPHLPQYDKLNQTKKLKWKI